MITKWNTENYIKIKFKKFKTWKVKYIFLKQYFVILFQLLKKGGKTKMEDQYPSTNLYDGQSDDDLKQIEDEFGYFLN